jgi:hypothetical protein
MQQVPASVWNQIAQTQPLQNPDMRQLFTMSQPQLDEALASQAQALSKAGQTDSVINAYQLMAPLLAENQAISNYINQTGHSDLRSALPEVLNAPEAVAIASQENPLSKSEQATLLKLLLPLMPTSSVNV